MFSCTKQPFILVLVIRKTCCFNEMKWCYNTHYGALLWAIIITLIPTIIIIKMYRTHMEHLYEEIVRERLRRRTRKHTKTPGRSATYSPVRSWPSPRRTGLLQGKSNMCLTRWVNEKPVHNHQQKMEKTTFRCTNEEISRRCTTIPSTGDVSCKHIQTQPTYHICITMWRI